MKQEYVIKSIEDLNECENIENKNLLIKADNIDVLKLLNYKYKNNIDVIYIDPIYNDKKHDWYNNIIKKQGIDKHKAWAEFMKERLILVEDLMSEESVLFISINDEEVYNLKILCDEIFKKLKFTCNFIWDKGATSSNNNKKNINICNEYILCYSTKNFKFNLDYKDYKKYKCNHGTNFAVEEKIDNRPSQLISLKSNKQYTVNITLKDGSKINIDGSKYKQETINRYQKQGKIFVNDKNKAYCKSFAEEEKQGICYKNILMKVGTSKQGTSDIESILGEKIKHFYPKPVDLIKTLLEMSVRKNSKILDFFAGTGTTGQAVLELNKDLKYDLKFILCTNNESEIFEKICFPRIKELLKNDKNENLEVYEMIERNEAN